MSRVQILSRTTNGILLLEREKGKKNKKQKLGNALQKAAGCETTETAAVAMGAKWLVNKLEHCGSLGYDKSSSVFTIEIAGYVWPTEALCLLISILRSSSVVFRYTGLSKFMLFLFLICQLRHIK